MFNEQKNKILFASIDNKKPTLVKILKKEKDFYKIERLEMEDILEGIQKEEEKIPLNKVKLFPEIPIDTKYCYEIVVFEDQLPKKIITYLFDNNEAFYYIKQSQNNYLGLANKVEYIASLIKI